VECLTAPKVGDVPVAALPRSAPSAPTSASLPRRVRSVCVCTLSKPLVNVPDVAVLSDSLRGMCVAPPHLQTAGLIQRRSIS